MLTRHITEEEAIEYFGPSKERAIFVMNELNKLIDERGYITYSDVKYYYIDQD